MKNQALNQLTTILGLSSEDTARLLGVTKQGMFAWHRIGVPVKYCKTIEILTEGKINRRDLRPDDWKLYWE